jgi:DNA-binding NarL/FixJ family response regulator
MSATDVTTSASLPDPIKVALIEDQRTIREGLAALIGGTEGFRCTGSYGSMEEALKKIGPNPEDAPDVALVDIGLPGMSGIEGIGLLRERHPAMPVLMLKTTSASSKPSALALAATCSRKLRPRACLKAFARWSAAARRCRPKSPAACSNSSSNSARRSTPITT